jgi:hypothetical protein
MFVSIIALPYMFRSIVDHLQGYCSCAKLLIAVWLSSWLYPRYVAVFFGLRCCSVYLVAVRPVMHCASQDEQATKTELLMMSGVPVETCWAFNERWNNKFYYKIASCWLFILSRTWLSLVLRCNLLACCSWNWRSAWYASGWHVK